METLYIKKGKRYVPAGVHTHIDMYPGVWIVQKQKGSSSMQSIQVSELPEISSLVEAVQARRIAQMILELLLKEREANNLVLYNKSWGQFEWDMADKIIETLNKPRREAIHGNYDSAKFSGAQLAKQTIEEVESPSRKYTWHGEILSKLSILFDEIEEIGHRKVGTHEFVWYLMELKNLLKAKGYDLKNTSIGGMVINPENDE